MDHGQVFGVVVLLVSLVSADPVNYCGKHDNCLSGACLNICTNVMTSQYNHKVCIDKSSTVIIFNICTTRFI